MNRPAAAIVLASIVLATFTSVGVAIVIRLNLSLLDLLALLPLASVIIIYLVAAIVGGEFLTGYPGPTSMLRAAQERNSRLLRIGALAGFAGPLLVVLTTIYFVLRPL
jgi:hypothetical protein